MSQGRNNPIVDSGLSNADHFMKLSPRSKFKLITGRHSNPGKRQGFTLTGQKVPHQSIDPATPFKPFFKTEEMTHTVNAAKKRVSIEIS